MQRVYQTSEMVYGRQQRRVLNKYHHKYGRFKVAAHLQEHWLHILYPSAHARSLVTMYEQYDKSDGLTDRMIFQDEVVIETDMGRRVTNLSIAQKITKKLREHHLGYEMWFSGNKSYHIHIFLPELMLIDNPHELKLLKRIFTQWAFDCGDDPYAPKNVCSTCIYDPQVVKCKLRRNKVDMMLTGNHLIRLEFSQHPVTGKRKELIEEHILDEENFLPREVWRLFRGLKKKQTTLRPPKTPTTLRPCVDYLFKNPSLDARHRIAFILYNNFKVLYGHEKAESLLRQWNASTQENYLNESDIRGVVNGGKKTSRTPGCRYVHEILAELGKGHVALRCHGGGKRL